MREWPCTTGWPGATPCSLPASIRNDRRDAEAGGSGNDTLYGEAGNDLFIFREGDGQDVVYGGTGGGWTDVTQLQDAAGGPPANGWTYVLDSGVVETSGADFLDLSDDATGTITLVDGSEIDFSGIERIEW